VCLCFRTECQFFRRLFRLFELRMGSKEISLSVSSSFTLILILGNTAVPPLSRPTRRRTSHGRDVEHSLSEDQHPRSTKSSSPHSKAFRRLASHPLTRPCRYVGPPFCSFSSMSLLATDVSTIASSANESIYIIVHAVYRAILLALGRATSTTHSTPGSSAQSTL